tara:strand:+ start:1531 stop:1764 length:234 start_codon:yes stop_codon:yes gene_type:complete
MINMDLNGLSRSLQELMRASIGVVAIFAMKFALGYNFFTRKGGLPQEAKILACALGTINMWRMNECLTDTSVSGVME